LHDLRHTAATTLLTAGVDVRTAAGVLGHASPSLTLLTYAHLMPEARRDAVDRLGERLERLATVTPARRSWQEPLRSRRFVQYVVLSHLNDDFASRTSGFDVRQGVCGLFEWKNAIDDGPDYFRFNKMRDFA